MNLQRAVEVLGRAFLADPRNVALRLALADGTLDARAYFRELVCSTLRLYFTNITGNSSPPPWPSFVWSAEAMPHLERGAIAKDALDSTVAAWSEARANDHGRPRGLERDADLGDAYEGLLGLRAEIDHARGTLRLQAERDGTRKSAGAYYTPPAIVERLLDLVLEPVCDEAIARSDALHAERELMSLRVLDPACGVGAILKAAARRIARRIDALPDRALGTSSLARVIADTVAGTDIDPIAVEICRITLWLEAGREPDAATGLGAHVHCTDVLFGVESRDRPPSTQVHAVITNPPWLSYSGRQRARVAAASVERLIAREPALRAWPAAHSAFLLAAPRALLPGGRFGLVLPLAVAHLARYRSVRDSIERATDGDVCVIDCGEASFRGVVQPAGLFVGRVAGAEARQSSPRWRPENHSCAPRWNELVDHLQRLPKFDRGVFSDPGVHTGNVGGRIVHPSDAMTHVGWAPLREGKDIEAYAAHAPSKTLRTERLLEPGEYCRVGEARRYIDVPILIRQTARRPIAARHYDPGYFRNSLLACAGVAGVPHEIMLAVLNSCLIAAWHRETTLDAAQHAFPQVKVSHLRNLPAVDGSRLAAGEDFGNNLATRLVHAVRAMEESVRERDRDDPLALARERELLWRIELDVAELYDVPHAWAELAWRREGDRARARAGRRTART